MFKLKTKPYKRGCLLLIICCIFSSCADLNNLNKTQTFQFDIQGHRGCRGWMPENTIPAMIKAIDLGVNTLEMDVCFTKDLQAIVSHESFFNHEITTKPDGTFVTEAEEKNLDISQMDYEKVKHYDVGKKIHPRFPQQKKLSAVKPRLIDLIDAIEKYCLSKKKNQIKYSIAIKIAPGESTTYDILSESLIEKIITIIKEKNIESRVIIQSFNIQPLKYIHQHHPAIATALLIDEGDKKSYAIQLKELGFIPDIYSPHFSLVTPLLVKQCKDMNVRLIPWLVNEANTFEMLEKMGVNGMITDYPPKGL